MPLTSAEKSKRQRENKKAQGLVYISEYGTPEQKTNVKLYLAGEAKIVKVKK